MEMMMDDPFFWFKRNRLVIPGVRGEHLLMHISDTHISTADEDSSPEERAETEKQEAMWAVFKEKFARGQLDFAKGNDEPYGEAQRIGTVEAFEKQLALAAELKPEALLLSGDNLERMHGAGERYLKRKLAAYPGRFLCVPGNHEAPECDGAWSTGVRTLEFDGFRVAAVDNSRKTVSDADLAALKALCAEGRPILLLCHIPLSTASCREEMHRIMDYFYIDGETADENGREFISLCENSGAIRAVLCGHVHGYHAMEFAPGKLQVIGSQGMAGAVDLVTVTG
jgi:3',5'-cyclic AMP phosphodiesterase CpdA